MFTKEDIANLGVIFSIARKAMAENEQELIAIINYKKDLFDRFTPKEKEEAKADVATEQPKA